MSKQEKIVNTQLIAYLQNEKMPARVAHTTEKLRQMYAEALFQKLLKDTQGCFTMRTIGSRWHLTYTNEKTQITAQGKTLAHAVIALSVKNGFTLNTQSV